MFVDRSLAGEEFAEGVRTDGEREHETDRRSDRVPTTDPLPEREAPVGCDTELDRAIRVGRDRADLAIAIGGQPLADQTGIGHRLVGREGLGRDHHERAPRIERAEYIGRVGRVDVGDEVRANTFDAMRPQGLVGQARPEIAAADTDVHDVGESGTIGRHHLPGVYVVDELEHAIE